MSHYKFAEIHCDIRLFVSLDLKLFEKIPFEHDDYWQPGVLSMSEAVQTSQRNGWTRKRMEGKYYDFCPACTRMIEGDG